MTMIYKLTNHFDSAINILTVPTCRSGLLCKETYIFLPKNYDGNSVL